MNLDDHLPPTPTPCYPKAPSFTVQSRDARVGELINQAHVYAGGNRSPELSWSDVPAGTKSFVVTCFDPDAPTPSGFWHWIVVDLPASVKSLASDAGKEGGSSLPKGAFHCRNDYGAKAYGGPAPPSGDRLHRYYFVVHALDVERLGVDDNTSPAAVSFTMLGHTLGRAIVMATYQETQ